MKKVSGLSIISLFSGAGGLDFGFKKAGFKTIWANEFDKQISPTFIANFKGVDFDGRSIIDIPNSDIPSGVVGVIGGPPCQSWSAAGSKRGIDDPKGRLFNEYIRVIKHIKPLFFVAENVSGMLHPKHKPDFDRIIKKLERAGYHVSVDLLNARNYGVPQDRKRVIIVGYKRSHINKKFVFPPPGSKEITLRDAISHLRDVPLNSKFAPNHEICDATFSPFYMSRNRVRLWDEPSFTIPASERHIPMHPDSPPMVKIGKDLMRFSSTRKSKLRRLSIRECACIQTFPDTYKFIYNRPFNAYKMIGNAVPVKLAYSIAKAIKADLF
jgi:DNA (cytosine-5)-methyltransferase 1